MKDELSMLDYYAMKTSEPTNAHAREAQIECQFRTSRWRPLDCEEPEVQWRYIERYPFPPLKLLIPEYMDESKESAGYWLAGFQVHKMLRFIREYTCKHT
jgi:hypothetical protein